jgi:uroporphyrinogen decarboxylase
MNSKQRVLTALEHMEPDRVPIHVDFTPEAATKLARHLGLAEATAEAYSGQASQIPLVMGHDLLVAWHGIATSYYSQPAETYTCEWGIAWRWVDVPGGRYTEMMERPLSDAGNLKAWDPPDASEEWRYEATKRLLAERGRTHAIVGAMPCTLFEAAWYLRGYEEFMTDMVVNKGFAHALLDEILRFQLTCGSRLADLGADIIWMGDDFGTQRGLLISAGLWREFFKPRYERMISTFKGINPQVKVAYHSDGNIEELLPEYIEVGVDIYNAVQPGANDIGRLKRRFGRDLSFWGTVDIQEVMPFGKPEDVHAEVRRRILAAGPGGGLILAPSHNIQPDVPLENILAFYEAAREYGSYPLS